MVTATSAHAEVTIPASPAVVADEANVIDAATEQRITDLLMELRSKTTAEVKVIAVQTIGDEDAVGFAQRHYDQWKLGAAGKDNGALIVLAIAQRQVRIHTGYGLESVLPDIWCASESDKVAKSYFSAGQYGNGLQVLTNAVANKIALAANIRLSTLTETPAPPKERRKRRTPQSQFTCCMVLVVLMLLGGFGGGRRRGRHYRRWGGGGLLEGLFWGSVLSRTFGSSGGSWGGSGGGFGGFGGGGFGGGGGFMGGGGFSGGGGGGASW